MEFENLIVNSDASIFVGLVPLGIMQGAVVWVMIEINSPPVCRLLCNYNHNGGCAQSPTLHYPVKFVVN